MTSSAATTAAIPASHLDLLTRPVVAVLTTMLPDGQPHSTLAWTDFDGQCARTNTSLDRRTGRNLLANPSVSLLAVDPDDTSRFIQIRGTAELLEAGAVDQLDELARAYTSWPAYYGYVFPEDRRSRETRVTVRIHARRVSLDAIHA